MMCQMQRLHNTKDWRKSRTGKPDKSTSSKKQKHKLELDREERKYKGGGRGSISDKVECKALCVMCDKVVRERWCVTKLCVKDGM